MMNRKKDTDDLDFEDDTEFVERDEQGPALSPFHKKWITRAIGTAGALGVVYAIAATAAHYSDWGTVGGKFLPVVKAQWGTVVETGQCTRSSCAVVVKADDGRLFTSSQSQPRIVGQRVPVTEYVYHKEPESVFFEFHTPRGSYTLPRP